MFAKHIIMPRPSTGNTSFMFAHSVRESCTMGSALILGDSKILFTNPTTPHDFFLALA